MLSESGSLFYRPKQKKLEGAHRHWRDLGIELMTSFVATADTARQNFVKPGGDHFTLLNVWEQWQDSGFSISWTYEHFIQIKVSSSNCPDESEWRPDPPFAVSHSRTRHPGPARQPVRARRDLRRGESELERHLAGPEGHLCRVRTSQSMFLLVADAAFFAGTSKTLGA